jgi:DNA ligase (NAD+)
MENLVKKRILELIELINKWNQEYYLEDKPTVSDQEYDLAIQELKMLEQKHPESSFENSPTKKVGGFLSSLFEKYKHQIPMMSLDNAFNSDQIEKFCSDIYDKLGNREIDFVLENKIDGLSISVIYKFGRLFKAVTRGDGQTGEDVTANVLQINGIPLTIANYDEYFEVRGEIFVDKKQFLKINEQLRLDGLPLMANSRNLASGTIRQLDQDVVKTRNLKILFYFCPTLSDTYKQDEVIKKLSQMGFPTQDDYYILKNSEEIIEKIKNFDKDGLDYEIDGLVIKLNQRKYYEEVGRTSKFPKWAIAYKFPAQISQTRLIGIFSTVGRTFKITYNAILEPVTINNTKVCAATLHNAHYITSRDIRINDIVNVYKAGEIIPRVTGYVENEAHEKNEKWIPHTNCPSCNSFLLWTDNHLNQYCSNKNCLEVKIQCLEHFVSRDAMNIEGLSDKTLRKFIDSGIIMDFTDIYRIWEKEKEIVSMKSFKEKSFRNMVENINLSKRNSLERVVSALGIENIGKKAATALSKKFLTMEKLIKCDRTSLMEIRDFGDISINSLTEYFNDPVNIEKIKKLESFGVNMTYIGNSANQVESKFKNSNVSITGTFKSYKRDYLTDVFINSFGSKVSESVTSKTTYLICGSDAGSKLIKAKEKNIQIIYENELEDIMNRLVK